MTNIGKIAKKAGEYQSHIDLIRSFTTHLHDAIRCNKFGLSPGEESLNINNIKGAQASKIFTELYGAIPRRINRLCLELEKLEEILDNKSLDDNANQDALILGFIMTAEKIMKNDYSTTNLGFHLTTFNDWQGNRTAYNWVLGELADIKRLITDDKRLGSDANENMRL